MRGKLLHSSLVILFNFKFSDSSAEVLFGTASRTVKKNKDK